MNEQKIRKGIAIPCGLLLAIFGVFLFSDFQYRGLILSSNVFDLMTGGNFRDFSSGLHTLFGSGFLTNMFVVFSEEMETIGFFGVVFGEKLWPVILTYFSTGFMVGVLVKGVKQSLMINGILFLIIFSLWFILGLFAGTDIGAIFSNSILNTLGIFATTLIFLFIGALFGGLIGGRNYNN
jgi:hypothetical protein